MKYLKNIFLLSIMGGIVLSVSGAYDRDGRWPRPSDLANEKLRPEDYKALLNAGSADEMRKLFLQWKGELDWRAQEHLCRIFMQNLKSKRKLDFTKGNENFRHDLSIVGGRCLWATEQMLQCEMPPMTADLNEGETSEVRRLAYIIAYEKWGIVRQKGGEDEMNALKKKYGALPKNEKLRSATSGFASPKVLEVLSLDSDMSVRLAVAKNEGTDPGTLFRLYKDPSPEIKAAAKKNRNGLNALTKVNPPPTKPLLHESAKTMPLTIN